MTTMGYVIAFLVGYLCASVVFGVLLARRLKQQRRLQEQREVRAGFKAVLH